MFVFTRVGQYLVMRVLGGVFVALLAVLVSILLIDLVEQLRSTGTRTELSLVQAARLTLMKTPTLVEQTMPFVMLAGSMMAVIALNRSSELVALRAAGVSAWRFLAPPAFVGIVVGLLVITIVNPIGAYLYTNFEIEKARLVAETRQAPPQNGVWIRQGADNGQIVIHAESIDPRGATLSNASFMFFEMSEPTQPGEQASLKIVRRLHAERAELKPEFWQLTNIVEAAPGGEPERAPHLSIRTDLDAAELLDRFVAPATLSFWRLPGFIGEARRAGFAPVRYELKWQGLLAYPVMLAAMAGLGAVFSLRLQRLGNLAAWGAVGVGLGLFLFFYSQLAGAFAITQTVPPLVAAWAAPLAGGFIALALVAFLEDG